MTRYVQIPLSLSLPLPPSPSPSLSLHLSLPPSLTSFPSHLCVYVDVYQYSYQHIMMQFVSCDILLCVQCVCTYRLDVATSHATRERKKHATTNIQNTQFITQISNFKIYKLVQQIQTERKCLFKYIHIAINTHRLVVFIFTYTV
jgi:hypothetical protein